MGMPYPIKTCPSPRVDEFGRSRWNRMCTEFQNFRSSGAPPFGMGHAWPSGNTPLPICHNRYRASGTSIWRSARRKEWRPYAPLSRSIKVIGTETIRSATYDFLLVIHGNHIGISCTVSEITTISVQKREKFSSPDIYLTPHRGRLSGNFVTTIWVKRITLLALPDVEKFLWIVPYCGKCVRRLTRFRSSSA